MSPVLAFEEYREHTEPVAQTVPVTVIAQDPSVKAGRHILTAVVRIPAEHLEAGPRGARLHVVDYDNATDTLGTPTVINLEVEDRFSAAGDEILRGDADFRAQNVYAIAARTLSVFESALGRRLCWAFGGHQLYLVPHAFAEANAYYSPEDGAIYFGYVPAEGGQISTALSHDVIAHEATHAILDGLRPRFAEPGLPDQPAFHEALADIVALLSVFSLRPVVERLLGPANARGRLARRQTTRRALASTALFAVAEELGHAQRGAALRRSVVLQPSIAWREDPAFVEPHRRAEVLVAAVMQTLLTMWTQRLEAITTREGADRSRVAEEGATAAAHLLRMMTRGVDYLPPVELEFEDVVDSVLQADEVVAPDDEHGYRPALAEAFAAFGIHRPAGRIVDLSRDAAPVYDRMNYAILRSDRDEVFRFLWDNAEFFGINRSWRTQVESVRSSVRIGPDGLSIAEAVATYVQSLDLTGRELTARGVPLPRGVEPDTPVQVWGGGVLIFDQFGRAKYHQSKRLEDWDRQARRVQYLADRGLRDRDGRFGFTISTPRGQRFAALHVAEDRAGEDW
jgi:hypothetical protein